MVTTRDPTPRTEAGTRRMAAAERRAAIEEAAARLFAERGYGATTVDEIVAQARVSKPMLYRHYESKKELYMKLMERRRDELAATALDVYVAGETHRSELPLAMAEAWFSHVGEHPSSSRMLFQDALGEPEVQALQRELRARQRAADVALLRELAPGIPERELEALGEIIRSSLTGLALWWLENPQIPREVPVAAIVRMTRGLLSAGS